MSFICRKSITLSNTRYMPGDIIPGNAVLRNRVGALKGSGHIVEVEDSGQAENGEALNAEEETGDTQARVEIPIECEEGTLYVSLTAEEIARTFAIMQMTADNATAAIEEVESEDVLILLDASDSRKSVQKAAKTQASKLSSTQTDSNAPLGYTEPTTAV